MSGLKRLQVDALPRLYPRPSYSTFDRPRRNQEAIKQGKPLVRKEHWGKIYFCVEYPHGIYIDKKGVPQPTSDLTGRIRVDDTDTSHTEEQDKDYTPEGGSSSEEDSSSESETTESEEEDKKRKRHKRRKKQVLATVEPFPLLDEQVEAPTEENLEEHHEKIEETKTETGGPDLSETDAYSILSNLGGETTIQQHIEEYIEIKS
jgi:hypothetical protein